MPKPLRVLFAIGSLSGGGSERQLVTILQHLDRTRIEPTLYLLHRSGEFLKDVPADVPVIACSDAVAPPRLYVPGRAYRQQVRHLTQTLRDGNFDLLYDRTILMAGVAGPAARRAGVPRVATVVADPDRDMQALFRRFGWFKRRVLERGYRNAARVIANSEALRCAVAQRFALPESQTATIPNGFDIAAIQRQAAEAAPVTLDPQRIHIAAMGRFQPQKGFLDLLRALRILVVDRKRTDLTLWLVGSGPDEPLYRDYLATEPALAEHVQFPGFLSNPFALLSRCRLFCLSSLYEGSPNALVEAMACGVPVVSTDCPFGPHETLDGGRYGELVPAGDCQAFAAAIERVLGEEALTRERATIAARSVCERFDAHVATHQLENVIAEARRQADSD